jgi:hypothetical protein
MKFESCTLIVDFKAPIVEHIIEKILSFGIELNIYSFNSTGDDNQEVIFLEFLFIILTNHLLFKKKKILKKYNLIKIDSLELALKKDVVFSFLDSTSLKSFDKVTLKKIL